MVDTGDTGNTGDDKEELEHKDSNKVIQNIEY